MIMHQALTENRAEAPLHERATAWNGLGRSEFKYLLKPEYLEGAVDFLTSYAGLERDHRRPSDEAYTVRSIYFDSPALECFHAKREGQQHREKFRLRTYGAPGYAPLFLEHKIKNGSISAKDRVALSPAELAALATQDYDSLNSTNLPERTRAMLNRLFFYMYRRVYAPAVHITYERRAYNHPEQDTIRVTLDSNLRARMFPRMDAIYEESGLARTMKDWIILEVKCTCVVPWWLRSLSARFHLRRQSCSKYATCIAYFLSEIPNLKEGWHYV